MDLHDGGSKARGIVADRQVSGGCWGPRQLPLPRLLWLVTLQHDYERD